MMLFRFTMPILFILLVYSFSLCVCVCHCCAFSMLLLLFLFLSDMVSTLNTAVRALLLLPLPVYGFSCC